MSSKKKNLSNPFSTGSGGPRFESQVQASFVALMLVNGYCPCLPTWSINKIKLQGKYAGYNIDDLIIFVKSPSSEDEVKLLCQIKHTINITKNNQAFSEVIQAAWSDFQNCDIFREGKDMIALITGPLSAVTSNSVRPILERARDSENSSDFLLQISESNFSSNAMRKKLDAFRYHLKKSNKGIDVTDDQLWLFLKSFHLLGYDLDIKSGVLLSFLHSLIGQFSTNQANQIWSQLVAEVQSKNQNAGTITKDALPEEILSAFERKKIEEIPEELTKSSHENHKSKQERDFVQSTYPKELALSCLLGSWSGENTNDVGMCPNPST